MNNIKFKKMNLAFEKCFFLNIFVNAPNQPPDPANI